MEQRLGKGGSLSLNGRPPRAPKLARVPPPLPVGAGGPPHETAAGKSAFSTLGVSRRSASLARDACLTVFSDRRSLRLAVDNITAIAPNAVPEPASLLLLSAGGLGLLATMHGARGDMAVGL